MTEIMERKRKYAHFFDIASNVFKIIGIAALLILSFLQGAIVQRTLDVVIDCTAPNGHCYREGTKRTSTAVIQNSEISKYAAVCADRPGTITAEEMDDCIQEQLKARK